MSVLTFLAVFGGVVAFLIAAWKYVNTRKFEAETKRFEQYRLVCGWLAGKSEIGVIHDDVQQTIAVYQLAEFFEYREISLPIIDYYLEKMTSKPSTDVFKKALLTVRSKLTPPSAENLSTGNLPN